MTNTPILSICIPTYNRADILNKSLYILTSNEAFDDQTEVVIVDNCSTDHTPSVIQFYSNKYKNIVSYRNTKNIGFNNGERVLSLANGKYLKLINDYVIINNDCLHFILNEIRNHLKDQTPLFFLNGMAYSDLKKIYCDNLNDYINRVSIFVTYWPFFGVWKEHWDQLTEKKKYAESLIPQDYWTYKIIVNNGKCLIYNDALFAKIQKLFLDEQKKLFGTDHIYGLDPFNEVDPPSFEPEYLRKIASDMYATLTAADPKAQWMQMTWMFYFDKDKWTSERMKALLTGVPQNKMILLDYHCENVELWKRTEHFHDQPYIWCYLGNFGGNTTLTGNVKESGARLENALINGGGNLKGIGSTLEGLDVMQFPYEYILEKAWNLNVDDNKWIECLADRHVGCVSQPVRDAWKRLFNDIYAQVPRTLGTLPGYRPVLNKNSEKRTSNVYSNVELLEVWRKLNEAPSDRRDAFRLDLITVGRQVLGNYFLDMKMEFDRMVEAKDYQALKACGEKMKEILNDLDKLNAFHPYCSLDKWIDDARKMGDSPQLKDYYEKNARNLITTWGGSLNDYASRSWAGLIRDYYAKRWEVYINTFIKAAEKGVEVDQKQLEDELKEIEEGWVNATDRKDVRKDIHSATDGLLSFSTFLFSKYQRLVK